MPGHSAQALGGETGSFRFSAGPTPEGRMRMVPGRLQDPGPVGPSNAVLSPRSPNQSVQDTGFCGLWTSGREEGGEDPGLRVHLGTGMDGPVTGPAASSPWQPHLTPRHRPPQGHCGHGRSSEVLPGRGGCSVGLGRAGSLGPGAGLASQALPSERPVRLQATEEVRLCPLTVSVSVFGPGLGEDLESQLLREVHHFTQRVGPLLPGAQGPLPKGAGLQPPPPQGPQPQAFCLKHMSSYPHC